jgi:hypothetical protein
MFKDDEGEAGLLFQLDRTNLKRAAFNKEYNRSKLAGILVASAKETLAYVNQDEVTVFKYDTDGKGCSLFRTASPMPAAVRSIWNSADSKDDGTRMMGLYVGKTTSKLQLSKLELPFIIVRENSTRWTLVHEYMHHLFMVRSLEQGHDDSQIFLRRNKALTDFEIKLNRSELTTESGVRSAVESFLNFVKIDDERNVHYVFEEMTIEDQLRRDFESRDLTFVTPYDYNSAGWYIEYSAGWYRSYASQLKIFISKLGAVVLESKLKQEEQAQIMMELDSIASILEKRLAQIKVLEMRNTKRESTIMVSGVGILFTRIEESHIPCQHSRQDREMLQRLKDLDLKFQKAF